jgi:hypothetical protein
MGCSTLPEALIQNAEKERALAIPHDPCAIHAVIVAGDHDAHRPHPAVGVELINGCVPLDRAGDQAHPQAVQAGLLRARTE